MGCKYFFQIANLFFYICTLLPITTCEAVGNTDSKGLPLYYWQQKAFVNFGDYLSLMLVERIVGTPVKVHQNYPQNKMKVLHAIGSILSFAKNDDIIWGSGVNGKVLQKKDYKFHCLDVRSVRGPLSRAFLWENFQIQCPEIYGDPALLTPYFFPEFKRAEQPRYPYIIIPHYSETHYFSKEDYDNVVYPTDPWDEVISKILDSEFVISSAMHGIIVAEAYGIPARQLRITENEPLFKYMDYYYGTNRPDFKYASSVEEALEMGGEKPFECDLKQLYEAFPFEFWPGSYKEYGCDHYF
jgi:pyruvyltransferase